MRKLTLIFLLLTSITLHAQQAEKTRVLLLLDCSQSMWDKWQSDSKIKVTQQILLRLVDSIPAMDDMEVALRVFGHRNQKSISSQLLVPFEPENAFKLKSKIKALVPYGDNSAAASLITAPTDFPTKDPSRNIIILITDGIEDSEQDICTLSDLAQQNSNIAQIFIVGIGSPTAFGNTTECAGHFTLLTDEERFDETLSDIFFLSDQKALVTLSLIDNDNRPYQTDVPVTFNDHQTHTLRYTVNYHYSTEDPIDTLAIDPLTNYDITIHTLPPIHLSDRHFKPGSHTHLQVPASQGSLRLHHENRRFPFQLPEYNILVHRHGEPELLAIQSMNAVRNYLAGQYDIEILTLPVTRLTNIKLRGGAATDLQIPLPGQLALNKPGIPTTGCILVFQGNSLQWVCDLDPTNPTERILLMPGDYQVILRPLNDPDPDAVRTARFTIRTGQQTGLTVN